MASLAGLSQAKNSQTPEALYKQDRPAETLQILETEQ